MFLDTDIGREEICNRNMKIGVAVVRFQLATETVTQIEKKLRYSVADYLSNIGEYFNESQFRTHFIAG